MNSDGLLKNEFLFEFTIINRVKKTWRNDEVNLTRYLMSRVT